MHIGCESQQFFEINVRKNRKGEGKWITKNLLQPLGVVSRLGRQWATERVRVEASWMATRLNTSGALAPLRFAKLCGLTGWKCSTQHPTDITWESKESYWRQPLPESEADSEMVGMLLGKAEKSHSQRGKMKSSPTRLSSGLRLIAVEGSERKSSLRKIKSSRQEFGFDRQRERRVFLCASFGEIEDSKSFYLFGSGVKTKHHVVRRFFRDVFPGRLPLREIEYVCFSVVIIMEFHSGRCWILLVT